MGWVYAGFALCMCFVAVAISLPAGNSFQAILLLPAIGVAFLLWHVVRPMLKAQATRAKFFESNRVAQEHAEAERKKRREDEQKCIRRELNTLVSNTNATVEMLPTSVSCAEAWLDKAEEEFAEGAYVPFWDAVEKAVRNLAAYDAAIQIITSNSRRIPEEIKKLNRPPNIDLSNIVWPDAVPTIKRMNQIVRQAQKNKDFTTIFLQIRTNQILDAGFANLGSAISDMGSRIQGSISTLTQSVDFGMTAIREQQASIAEKATEQRNNIAAAQHERDNTQTEMLDNIQRRRKPLPEKYRDGQY